VALVHIRVSNLVSFRCAGLLNSLHQFLQAFLSFAATSRASLQHSILHNCWSLETISQRKRGPSGVKGRRPEKEYFDIVEIDLRQYYHPFLSSSIINQRRIAYGYQENDRIMGSLTLLNPMDTLRKIVVAYHDSGHWENRIYSRLRVFVRSIQY